MNTLKAFLLTAMLAFGAECIQANAADGVDIIVNESTGATSLDKEALKNIFLGKTAYWGGGEAVVIVVQADQSDAGMDSVAGMSASQFKTHWQRLTFSGRGKQPKTADSPDKVVEQVAQTKGAIAIVPSGTALNGVKKVEIK